MVSENLNTTQKIPLKNTYEPEAIGKKQARIELRLLKDAIPLTTVTDTNLASSDRNISTNLRRVTAYCVADKINIREFYKDCQKNGNFKKVTIYFCECIYTSYTFKNEDYDLFFFDYGVVIFWGLNEYQESILLKQVKNFEVNSYEASKVEIESFKYGIVKENPMVINDIIYLSTDDFFNKMVISCAIAQSLKLDYFENLVDSAIEGIRDLPAHVEHVGKVGKNRREIMKIMGRLHCLKLNLNLVSNILDEPDLLWHYPLFSNLYETFRRYLEIKIRADVLNQRVDVIRDVLQLLSENITTRNSEKLKKIMIFAVITNSMIMTVLLLWLCKSYA